MKKTVRIAPLRNVHLNGIISDSHPLKILQYVVYGSVILYFGREVFIPISFALLIGFVLYPVCAWLEKKGFGKAAAIVVSLSLLVILGLLVGALLVYQFLGFLEEWPAIQTKVSQGIVELSNMIEQLGLSKGDQSSFISKLTQQSENSLATLLKTGISASAFSIILLVLIPVYSFLILYYRHHWIKILGRLFPGEKKESLIEILKLTIKSYYNFIKGMLIVYVVVGILNSIGLLLLGVPYAILFGFIASILTFIPYVGIIVGSLLPMAMAWLTYDSIWYPLGVVGIFAFVQYLEANVIFPVAVSSRLNVNTMAMLTAIFIGALLWGMAGMILFVPFIGILKLIADHNPKWKTYSMILGNSE
jgi:predicted PurR-regulated permease PerM